MIRGGKKGLSPVIATVLLVAITLVLAIIVFLWARSFVGESIQKEGRDIDQSCGETGFRAEVIRVSDSEATLFIENTGRVPLFGAEIRKKQVIGEIKKVETFQNKNVYSGETGEIDLSDIANDLNIGDSVIIVPVLLGETEQAKKAYVCDKDYGVETVVK